METANYKLIVTIVTKGKGNKVVDIAHDAGARGSTILFGHGAAVQLLLGIKVDPEKDIVLTIIEDFKAQKVLSAISSKMELESPHKGLAFMLAVDQVIGINSVGKTDTDLEESDR
ncbi:MAG: P-II family nitrogen regulator [Coriobacteriia bacterium]|nr:P-II family nitrogen regulator [Coriobacteriia bacterium]MCL2750935.1 P-II family nitrogen regulator [Coriobacteriia bacterium]